MIRRTLMLWLGLLALPFLLHCTPDGQALPPLQTLRCTQFPKSSARSRVAGSMRSTAT